MNIGVDQLAGRRAHLRRAGRDAGRSGGGHRDGPAGVHHGLCIIHEEQNAALTDRCDGFSKQLATTGGTVTVLHVNGAQLHEANSGQERR